jgi:sulfonate transport system ATP-binding protein
MGPAMLDIRNVSKSFSNGARVLDGIDLTVYAGEIVAIVGASGCGKSTLLRIISGLDDPTEGHASVNGIPINGPHPAVGLIFQEPRLLPWLTVAQNVAFGLHDLSKTEQRERVKRGLELIGLPDLASRWPRELSGGQSQRVAIARALVARPSVVLLDEPFSALDAFTRVDLQEHLLHLRREMKLTLVIVTHDIDEAIVLADRIVVLRPNPGRISKIAANSRDRNAADVRREVLESFDLSDAAAVRTAAE